MPPLSGRHKQSLCTCTRATSRRRLPGHGLPRLAPRRLNALVQDPDRHKVRALVRDPVLFSEAQNELRRTTAEVCTRLSATSHHGHRHGSEALGALCDPETTSHQQSDRPIYGGGGGRR